MKKILLKIYFWGGIIYQMIALISLFGCYPKDIFYNEYSIVGILFTLPISFISFGFRYAERDSEFIVIGIQFCIFLIFLLIYFFLKKHNKE